MTKIFRFDDVCINADMNLIQNITDYLFEKIPNCEILYGVSPLVHNMNLYEDKNKERVFPKILNAHSDYRDFYFINKAGIPKMDPRAKLAGHGLIHVDHRLLTKETQEISILTSCSLVNTKIFIPPFNKYNKHTEEICKEFNIELIKFEDGWLSMEYNKYNSEQTKWYLHAREWTFDKIKEWFEK